MNLEFYRIIGETLTEGIDKAYKAGLASVVKLNKKEILRLKDDNEPELFKINYTGTDYKMLQNFKVEAFTVAGVQSYELEEKLKQLALDIQEGKHPLSKGEKDIKELWVAEAQNLIGEYVPIEDMPPPHYLKTNLRTAMQSSYHAAQYNRLQDEAVRDLYPAYQYKTLADARVREEHRKLHDRIWRNNDEIWHRIWPPNGWNCRCYVKPLNQDEVNNSAVEPLTTSDEIRHDIVKKGKIGKNFDRNPGVIRSIWGKWKDLKFRDLDYNRKFKETFEYARSISNKQVVDMIQSEIGKYLSPLSQRDLTKENWDEDFPGNYVDTPLGAGNIIGDNTYGSPIEKIISKKDNRKDYYGAFKPTLNDPTFIIKDSRGGLIFVRAFINNDKQVYIFGIGYDKGEIIDITSLGIRNIDTLIGKIKNGEVLHLKSTALINFTDSSRKHFSFGSDLLNHKSKINFSNNIKNIKITADNLNENQIRNIMLSANEIWGETYNYNGVVNSELNFIRYRVDGFQLIKVNNNEAYETGFTGYDKINDFRKGVIIPNG